jgi:DNA-binding NtrC family response regulator
VGGEETLRVDVRMLAATHRNLKKEIETNRFREDLYYRLHILPIEIPPLRDRKTDIPLLVNHFLKRMGEELKKFDLKITGEALAILTAYDWPGNVRELENVLERAAVLSEENTINEETLTFMVSKTKGTKIAEPSLNLEARLASAEKHLLEQAMQASKGNKAKAARILGIKEGTLYYKLNKHGLSEME